MDVRRAVIMVILIGGLVWAFFNSPLTKGLRGGAAKRPTVRAPLTLDGGPSTAARPTVSVPAASPRASAGSSSLSKEELAQWRQRYENAWRRDPFLTAAEERALLAPRPVTQTKPGAPPAPLPSYTLKTILISEAGKMAALDGKLVGEGERIGEERVVEIHPDGVVLEQGGKRRTISLPGGGTSITVTNSREQGEKGSKR